VSAGLVVRILASRDVDELHRWLRRAVAAERAE